MPVLRIVALDRYAPFSHSIDEKVGPRIATQPIVSRFRSDPIHTWRRTPGVSLLNPRFTFQLARSRFYIVNNALVEPFPVHT